jgi:MFS family permease
MKSSPNSGGISSSRIANPNAATAAMAVDVTTILVCCCARFASAVARLSLGPLLPILSVTIFNNSQNAGSDNNDDNDGNSNHHGKAMLLSAYSTGYLLTQIVGGVLADRYGAVRVVAICCGLSSVILYATALFLSDVQSWRYAYFFLGVIAGPLFPACQTAAATPAAPSPRQSSPSSFSSTTTSSTTTTIEPAVALAWMDTAAAVGATLAAAAPLFSSPMLFYGMTSALLLLVAVTATRLSLLLQRHNNNHVNNNNVNSLLVGVEQQLSPSISSSNNNLTSSNSNNTNNTNNNKSLGSTKTSSTTYRLLRDMLLRNSNDPSLWKVIFCHSIDNFTKYSINGWAVTILVRHYGANVGTAGIILGAHEGLTVVSRLYWVASSASSTSIHQSTTTSSSTKGNSNITITGNTTAQRLFISAVAFAWQGLGYQLFFSANRYTGGPRWATLFLMMTAVAAGLHSIGYRTCYNSGATAGLGNTVASLCSIMGSLAVPHHRHYCFIVANVLAAMIAASSSSSIGSGSGVLRYIIKKSKNQQQQQRHPTTPRSSSKVWILPRTKSKEPEAQR